MQQIAKAVFFNINQIEISRWSHAAVAKSGGVCGLSFFFFFFSSLQRKKPDQETS